MTEIDKIDFNRRFTNEETHLLAYRCYNCCKTFEGISGDFDSCPRCKGSLILVGYLKSERN